MRQLYTGLFALLLATPLAAAEDSYSVVEDAIRELAPNVTSIAVSETPADGILMVQVNGEIVYATADGKYLLQGRLIDMKTRQDLTENTKSALRRDLLKDIDPKTQIIFSPEDPAYDLIVFTDIDCGYCRKLHSQIDEYNKQGIAIHYMSFPRAGIGSHSYEKAVSVWCADDPQTALTNAKLGSEPDPKQCDNPVAEEYELGQKLGVTGTPALVTYDGTLIPGYVPPQQLRERLDRMAAAAAAEADAGADAR